MATWKDDIRDIAGVNRYEQGEMKVKMAVWAAGWITAHIQPSADC
jgi:hypothetical protein